MTLILSYIRALSSFRGRFGLSLCAGENARVLLVAHLSFSIEKKKKLEREKMDSDIADRRPRGIAARTTEFISVSHPVS